MSECHRSPRTRGMLGDRGAGRKTLAMVVIFAWNLITLMEFSFVIRLVGWADLRNRLLHRCLQDSFFGNVFSPESTLWWRGRYYTGWLLCFRNVRLSAQCLFLLITFIGINSVAWTTTSSGTDGRSEPIGMIVIYTSREDGVMRVMVIRMAVTWKVLSVPFAQVKGKICILVVYLLEIGECVGSCVLNVINYWSVLDKITSMSVYMTFSSLWHQ